MRKEELINELRKSLTEPENAKEAVHFLSRIELEESFPYLISLLKEKISKEKKMEIIQILGESKQEQVIPVLEEMLKEEEAEIRLCALYSLIKIHRPQVLPILKEALENKQTKKVALQGLVELVDILPEEERKDILKVFLNALSTEESREEAIKGLGKMGDKCAVSPLMALFEKSDETYKRLILKSLSAIGGEEVKNFLFKKLKEEKEIKGEIIKELEKLYFEEQKEEFSIPEIWWE
ncbi:MAG: hypothetical protein DRP75_04475 [Candidatus Omnitrophota bacterium]|nr:MAG: hypothetical protein DRP75_04475 [Candidatus Omnitrophota bacterium]